jgi:hypothetical protein
VHIDHIDDLPPAVIVPTKNRLVLPPILSRQPSSSSIVSSTTAATLDAETNHRFALSSKQTSFMTSISEIS